jgi:glycine C-acetyltransferase
MLRSVDLATALGPKQPMATNGRQHLCSAPKRSFLDERLDLLTARYGDAVAAGTYCYQRVIEHQDGAWVTVGGRRLLMLASYGYLGLLGHPKIAAASQEAAATLGTGSHGVPLLAGTTTLHVELERAIADFVGTDAAVVFGSGYVANVATIAALATTDQVVICDRLDHASILDGCRLSGAKLMVYQHNDLAALERCLAQTEGRDALVVVDAVFSMDGDVAPMPEVVALCQRYGAALMVDEAHSLGVLGATGRGIAEHFDLDAGTIDIRTGTLSKSVPSAGGYVAGSHALVDALKHNARAFIFSAAVPPPQAAAASAAFAVVRDEPERVERLRRNGERYRTALRRLGFDLLASATPIVPLICPSEEAAFAMTHRCAADGVFVVPVVHPAVPRTSPRLRTMVTAAHGDDEIDLAVDVLARAGRRCGLIV